MRLLRSMPVTFLLALAVSLTACASRPATRSSEGSKMSRPPSAEDLRFAELARRWLDGTMRLSPIWATSVGDHRFDSELDDVTPEGEQKSLAFAEGLLADLNGIDTTKLGRENQIDAGILRTQLEGNLWTTRVLREHTWNPLYYNDLAGNAIYLLMARDFAPLPERLEHAAARIEKLPALLAQARKNLDLALVPKIHAETVAKQNHGIISLVDELIVPQLGKLPAAQRTRLEAAIAALRPAVAAHQKWIDEVLVPGAKGDFRIGADRYDHKLGFALSSPLSRKEIRERAEKELTRVRAEMYGIARVVLKDRPGAPELPAEPTEAQQQKAIEAALELAYVDHPARADVVKVATDALTQATAFVRAHGLVTVPDDPVKVILMPEFQRGVTVAYCDSPGPLDRGQATYYAISPIPEDWSAEQTESFLREYNTRMLHLLSIHEAMPGHYLEGAHSAMHPSVLRAVLRSGTFAEGWAVYTEQMMAHAGYLDGDPLFRLVQLKFYLRTIGNAILDQGVHVDGWTREQAMDLMVRMTFQQEREAAGKWTRAQLTSAQLPTYFVGVQEQLDLRKAVEAKEGATFDAKRYHDTVLSFGAPPTRYVREMMLDEPIR
jgi:uncharacterized protein (DUF885 family)